MYVFGNFLLRVISVFVLVAFLLIHFVFTIWSVCQAKLRQFEHGLNMTFCIVLCTAQSPLIQFVVDFLYKLLKIVYSMLLIVCCTKYTIIDLIRIL